jgi:hypothetical protein
MTTAVQNFVMPPPANRLGGESPTVEVAAALPIKGYDKVAADRLSWEGFSAQAIGSEGVIMRDVTVIYDYTGNSKPASLESMMKALRVKSSAVIQKPDPNRTVDFRVEMGRSYGTSCFYSLPADVLTPVGAMFPSEHSFRLQGEDCGCLRPRSHRSVPILSRRNVMVIFFVAPLFLR